MLRIKESRGKPLLVNIYRDDKGRKYPNDPNNPNDLKDPKDPKDPAPPIIAKK